MIELGMQMAETGRFDTEVPWQLLMSIAKIMGDHHEDKPLLPMVRIALKRPEVQQMVEDVLNGYLARPDLQDEKYRYLSILAAIQYHAERYELAKTTIEKVPLLSNGRRR